jgi:hypothetical protein
VAHSQRARPLVTGERTGGPESTYEPDVPDDTASYVDDGRDTDRIIAPAITLGDNVQFEAR